MRPFGRQTITFVSVTYDVTDLDALGKPALIRTPTDVAGCRFRPLPATQKVDDKGQVVTNPWKATCPPAPAVINATTGDELIVDGVTYKMVGVPRPTVDLYGTPFKVTVIAQQITG